MKSKHFFLSVLFLFVNLFQVTARDTSDEPILLKPKVIIRITLGAPPPSCTRFGICQLEVMPGWMRAEPGVAIAECQADESGNRVTFMIDTRTGIDAATLEKYFSYGVFNIEYDVWLDSFVSSALQVRAGSRIPSGKWTTTFVQGVLRFTIDLK